MTKGLSLICLTLAEVAGMGLWFTASALSADMAREVSLSATQQALLASAVQGGFVVGALSLAATGIADRFDPRRIFALSALLAAAMTALLLVLPLDGGLAVLSRAAAGAALAGVYPVGIRIAAAWGVRDRGFLVGLLVGALTLGSALPHLVAVSGGSDWRLTIQITSAAATLGGILVLFTGIGPHLGQLGRFHLSSLMAVWHDRALRGVYLGYFGHMWELYAMWAWLGAALLAAFQAQMPAEAALALVRLVVFAAIGVGALGCLAGGWLADRWGKVEVTLVFMLLSGAAALLTALLLATGAPTTAIIAAALLWGLSVIPDSPQFSALVADLAPAEVAGSLLTLQTALGFLLTAFTVQGAPLVAGAIGWPGTLALLALGPAFGIAVMLGVRARLQRRQNQTAA